MSVAETIPIEIERLARLIPGYDPFRDCDGYYLDHQAARDAVDFIEQCCTHIKGKWAKKHLKLEDWQKAIFVNLFGWKREADGTRRYRETLIFISRKNGKTCLAAAVVCLVLFTDGEPGAECYSSAAEREQARLCFEVVQGMIRNEPMMAEVAELYKYSVVVGGSSYKAVSAEAGTKHGYNAHLVVNDELHAHKTGELTEVLMTSTGSRTQPLFVHLTTSDYEREGSICNEKHDYACKVRDGVVDDPAFLPVVYEASIDDDWTDERTWEKANPNIDVSISRDYLRRECQRAKDDPSYENTFKRLHLNIRTEAFNRWITSDKWDACGPGVHNLQAEFQGDRNEWKTLADFAGVPCFAGIDLASTQDFNACVFTFKRDGLFWVFPKFWVPEATARKREKERRIPYLLWARNGWLTLTEGEVSDPDRIHADITAIIAENKLKIAEIPTDRMFQGMDLIRRLVADGFTAFAHGQGSMGMIPPTKTAKDAILGGYLRHDGNPVLSWMMSNVVVHPGDGKEYPMRDKSSDKIDGVVAMIMGVGRADLQPGEKKSWYDEHDFEVM